MNYQTLCFAKYYTYEARQDRRWLHRTIELLQQYPERGKYEDNVVGELFIEETIAVAQKLIKLLEIDPPPTQDISQLYNHLKFYKGVRNNDWDYICEYVEKWHWTTNLWNRFAGSIELSLWNHVTCKLCAIAQPIVGEGKLIRYSSSIDCYGHVVVRIEPNLEHQHLHLSWQIHENIVPSYYIPACFESILDELVQYFHQTNIAIEFTKIIFYDGSHHQINSKEIDYRIAAKIAWRNAIKKAELISL
ncbi:elongation factor G [Richelia sinica FACHB-800]|uniref:Elongation factor G n=1 Tax=Richelia sinica FACHB-800 TaxID=1357546 RepID=A0A975Y3P9_9NOST|nr:hypothetical protein [Richelia sinica]MBD2664886.1 hypothetical protein [Richelia sinica FACHB-800]QXE22363.1 elongation factor G [Richelia sinica FACHB-800]